MTSSQLTLGWTLYLAGVLGILLALRLITGLVNIRLRRMLLAGLAALLLTPWWHSADVSLLIPAFWIMLYDGLTHGFPAMARAGLPLVAAFGSCTLVAVSLPVKSNSEKKPAKKTSGQSQQQPRQRQEPTV